MSREARSTAPEPTTRVCPRCGSAAEQYEYCADCGLHLFRLTEIPAREEFDAAARGQPDAPTQDADIPHSVVHGWRKRRRILLGAGIIISVLAMFGAAWIYVGPVDTPVNLGGDGGTRDEDTEPNIAPAGPDAGEVEQAVLLEFQSVVPSPDIQVNCESTTQCKAATAGVGTPTGLIWDVRVDRSGCFEAVATAGATVSPRRQLIPLPPGLQETFERCLDLD